MSCVKDVGMENCRSGGYRGSCDLVEKNEGEEITKECQNTEVESIPKCVDECSETGSKWSDALYIQIKCNSQTRGNPIRKANEESQKALKQTRETGDPKIGHKSKGRNRQTPKLQEQYQNDLRQAGGTSKPKLGQKTTDQGSQNPKPSGGIQHAKQTEPNRVN